MPTLEERLAAAEKRRKEEQETITELRKKIRIRDAREERERAKREREEHRRNMEKLGEFASENLLPWMRDKSIKFNNADGTYYPKTIMEMFKDDHPDISIPSCIAEGDN